MAKETIFALAVSLLTWGGVWAYMLRLDRLTRALERTARELEARHPEPDGIEAPEFEHEEAGR